MAEPMSESEIEAKVVEAIAEQLGTAKESVTRESEFDAICDSLDKAELMMEFEGSVRDLDHRRGRDRDQDGRGCDSLHSTVGGQRLPRRRKDRVSEAEAVSRRPVPGGG